MPLPPLGHILLTQPMRVEGGVFIPELASRMHELPPPNVLLYVTGDRAEAVADHLRRRGRRVELRDFEPDAPVDPDSRPRWRLWQPDPWVEEVTSSSNALDVGCGSGRDAVALAARGWQVAAVDPLPDALDRGRDLEARYGDGPPIDWRVTLPDAKFELVLLIRCGRPELLEQALAHLAPNGRLLFVGRTDLFRDLAKRSPVRLETGKDWTRAEFRAAGPISPSDLLEKPV
jgi:SAM-dependent methyltransferase